MDKQEMVRCSKCNGTGQYSPSGRGSDGFEPCPACVPVEPAQPELPRELPLVNIDRGLDLSPELVSDLYEEWENPVKHTCDLERCLGCESWTRHVQELQRKKDLKRIAELEAEIAKIVYKPIGCPVPAKEEAQNL